MSTDCERTATCDIPEDIALLSTEEFHNLFSSYNVKVMKSRGVKCNPHGGSAKFAV
jgi:hypothetical protein